MRQLKQHSKNFTMRLDAATEILITKLANELNCSKAEVINKSLRLLKNLNSVVDEKGLVYVRHPDNEDNKIAMFI